MCKSVRVPVRGPGGEQVVGRGDEGGKMWESVAVKLGVGHSCGEKGKNEQTLYVGLGRGGVVAFERGLRTILTRQRSIGEMQVSAGTDGKERT